MAENKKSFILYTDLIHTVREMPKSKQADLFMAILGYVNDENPEVKDLVVRVAFEPIKQQLKRDLKRWENFREKQSQFGKMGGRPKNGKKENIENEEDKKGSLLSERVESLNVNATVNANVTVDVEIQTNNIFFEMFRRVAGYSIQDSELRQEIGKFRNKYPNVHPNQAGALINTWVTNIGKEQVPVKKMVL